MTINRTAYFSYARRAPFGNRLSQAQVDGQNAILDYWESHHEGGSVEFLAYILATAFHETGGTMWPVEENLNYTSAARIKEVWPYRFGSVAAAEFFVKSPRALANKVYGGRLQNNDVDDGWTYRGRGHVQITGRENYDRMGKTLGVPLVDQPELALDLNVSVKILVEGMLSGAFTGVGLADVITPSSLAEFGEEVTIRKARQVVNGSDKAGLIYDYYKSFHASIVAGMRGHGRGITEAAGKADSPPLTKDATLIGGVISGVAGLASAIGSVNNVWSFAALAVIVVGVGLLTYGRLKIRYEEGA